MRTGVVARGLVLGSLVGSASFVACQLVFPTALFEQTPAAPVADAATDVAAPPADAADSAPAVPSFLCTGAQPPPPPSQDSLPSSVPTFWVAIRTVSYVTSADAGPPLGFNLDGVCTCEDAGPPSCSSGSVKHCDGPDGRDVAGNALLEVLNSFASGGGVSVNLNSQIASGQDTILIGIANYNGGLDDTEVALTSYIASGLRGADGGYMPPQWDGNDAWDVDPASTGGSTMVDGGYVYTPVFVSTQAYVSNGVLVARVPKAAFGLGVGTVEATTVVLMGTLKRAPGSYGLVAGQVAGRVTSHSILSLVAVLQDPFNSAMDICGTDPTYVTVRQAVCGALDIAADSLKDNTGAPCDAISLGFGFEAFPARLGAPVSITSHVPGCDGAVDDCTP